MIKLICQPHLRLIYAFLISLIVSTIANIPLLMGLLASLLIINIIQNLYFQQSIKLFFIKFAKFNLINLLIWLTLSWKIGVTGLELNADGIRLAQLISLKMNNILLLIWLLLFNLNDILLVQAIKRLPLPEKLIYLVILTVRYISLIDQLNHSLDTAMKARGYQAKFNRRTMVVTSQRVTLLFIHAMIKAERSEIALKSRGFVFGNKK